MRPDVAFVYVRDLIERITGVRPDPDADGDLPVHFHGAQFFVRVIASAANPWIAGVQRRRRRRGGLPRPHVEAEPDQRLHPLRPRVPHRHSGDHRGGDLGRRRDAGNFLYACQNIAAATDTFAPDIQKAFGGRLLFEESKTDAYQQGSCRSAPSRRAATTDRSPPVYPGQGSSISPYL